MARRYLNLGPEEWRTLPWPVQRAYLEGMEKDESVPLTFERQDPADGMPDGMRWQERNAGSASVIDITDMITGLEASRGGGR